MTWCRRLLLAQLFLALASVPATATATLTCEAEDRNLAFDLLGNIGQAAAAVLQVTGGSITLKAVPGKHDKIEFKLDPTKLVQQWVFEKELRIGIQTAETKGFSLYLAIIAQRIKSDDDRDRYRGRYALKVQSPKGTSSLTGRIKRCEAG